MCRKIEPSIRHEPGSETSPPCSVIIHDSTGGKPSSLCGVNASPLKPAASTLRPRPPSVPPLASAGSLSLLLSLSLSLSLLLSLSLSPSLSLCLSPSLSLSLLSVTQATPHFVKVTLQSRLVTLQVEGLEGMPSTVVKCLIWKMSIRKGWGDSGALKPVATSRVVQDALPVPWLVKGLL